MNYPIINKKKKSSWPPFHLADYQQTCKDFSWSRELAELTGTTNPQSINIAALAVDRHASSGAADSTAILALGEDGQRRAISYGELAAESSRFANVLEQLGVQPGGTVFSLTGRIALLPSVIMGAFKHLNTFCPLFQTFGPEPVGWRLQWGKAVVLVTTSTHLRRKIEGMRSSLPDLRHILLVDVDAHPGNGVWSLPLLLAGASAQWTIPETDPETPALLHFTSGTTSLPKGALHAHRAVLTHYVTGKYVLDFHPGDIFWCTADPGWVTGTVYSLIAPLLHGVTNILDEADFDAMRWIRILEEERVNIVYTSPSAIRRLQRIDSREWRKHKFQDLRALHCVGEPLDPEAVLWGQQAVGLPVHDNWWQTETGGIMVANFPGMAIKPGSMGRPIPGISAEILVPGTSIPQPDNSPGMLAIKVGWPSQFCDYLEDHSRYLRSFIDDWYLSGDLAYRDEDGYFYFLGRSDDIIKTAGHMVSPFEVESTLNGHPKVMESAVFGLPDPMLGQLVHAAVVMRKDPAEEEIEALKQELLGYARKMLGSAVAPREIEIVTELPKNRSGKIMRRLLKAKKIGETDGGLLSVADNSDQAE